MHLVLELKKHQDTKNHTQHDRTEPWVQYTYEHNRCSPVYTAKVCVGITETFVMCVRSVDVWTELHDGGPNGLIWFDHSLLMVISIITMLQEMSVFFFYTESSLNQIMRFCSSAGVVLLLSSPKCLEHFNHSRGPTLHWNVKIQYPVMPYNTPEQNPSMVSFSAT